MRLALILLAAACGGETVDSSGACGAGDCPEEEACVHQAADQRGACFTLPESCSVDDPCACADLPSLCDESTDVACEIGEGGAADVICL